jgi:hypothetical protein
MADFSLDDIKKYSTNPTSIAAPGSYGEGQITNISNMLNTLKGAVSKGDISLTDYSQYADPLVKQAASVAGSTGRVGGDLWNQLVSNGFAKNEGGKWQTALPFSRQEYARLPDNVLPTQTDVQKGFFDPSLAPIERYNASAPQATDGASGTGTNSSTSLTGTKAGLDLRTDQGQLEGEGARQAQELLGTLKQQSDLRKSALGDLSTSTDALTTQRKQNMSDLATTLAQNQMTQFNRAIPDLAEQANTAGILPSTGFGTLLSNKYSQLTADTQNQLAQQGISDSNTALAAKAGIAQQGYNNADQYASGLGDVANTKLGFQTSGLQREFSLDDFAKQADLVAKYGTAPAAPTGGSKGGGALQGALGGAAAGAAVGGPWAALGGAAIGAAGGGQLAKKA